MALTKKRIESEGRHWGGRKAIEVTPEIKEIIDLWNGRRLIQRDVLEELEVLGARKTTAYRLKSELKI